MAKAEMIFPGDFLWGTATSAHQIEGNNRNNDWWQWEQAGRIPNGDRSGLACDWWEAAEEDLDRAAEIGTSALRLSIEWSRVEPEPGRFDEVALARYREILKAVISRKMEPMVTLHHFTNPIWLADQGDFNTDSVVNLFSRFVERVVAALGDLVPRWITINEPMVFFVMRYLARLFPGPSVGGWTGGRQAIANLLRCHAASYKAVKTAYPEAMVGVAKNYLLIEPRPGSSPFGRWWSARVHRFLNNFWMDCMVDGRLRWPFGSGVVADLAGSFDFVGISYYSRFRAPFPPISRKIIPGEKQGDGILVDDRFFEVYPGGLFMAIKDSLQYGKPIFITENGLADKEDRLRSYHLLSHLREVWRAINFNFPVMGYYYRTLIDSFEWDRGWTQRYGLIEMDPVTQKRTWRKSAYLYHEICRQNAISSEMARRFAPELMETMFPGQAPGR